MNSANLQQTDHLDESQLSSASGLASDNANTEENASTELSRLNQLSVIIAHEDRNTVQIVKDALTETDVALQIHRVTSLDDLSGSLQVQDWDVVCSFSESNEFDPKAVCEIALKNGNGASPIYIDTGNDKLSFDVVLSYGFTDHISTSEPKKIFHSIFREATAARNARLVQSNLDLIEEYNRKNALLLNASSDAIAYVADGMIMHGNQSFVELLAFNSLDDLVWQSFIDFVSDEGQNAFKAALRAFRKNPDETEPVETLLSREDDTELKVSISFAAATHEGEACTQLVIKDLSAVQLANDEAVASNTNSEVALEHTHNDQASESTPASNQGSAQIRGLQLIGEEELKSFTDKVQQNSAKGFIFCAHVSSDQLYSNSGNLLSYHRVLNNLYARMQSEITQWADDALALSTCSWLISIHSDDSTKPKALLEKMQSALSALLESEGQSATAGLISAGCSPFGVADIDAAEAINKAYDVCTQKVSGSGGLGEYQPRISDSASSSAILSALELERLNVKFQPVIALQGQSTHLYDACLFLTQDDGVERLAHADMRSLGVEVENTQLDKWFYQNVLEKIIEAHKTDKDLCVNIPVTASGVVHKDFFPDIMLAFDNSGLPKSCISFSANVDVAEDYPDKIVKLFTLLRQAGFNTSLENVTDQHQELISSIKPSFAYIDPTLSDNKNNENWRQDTRTIFDCAKAANSQSVVCSVNSAADLAQIWQSGAPFVKGSYLQDPIAALDYEFSDLH